MARNAETVPFSQDFERSAVIAAAWLHDVIEDSEFTANDLLAGGIPQVVIDAVLKVTDLKVGSRDAYYANIKTDSLARAVKLADIADNANLVRTQRLVDSGVKFDHNKYPHALEVLELNPTEKAWFDEQIKLQPDAVIYFDMDDVIVNFKSGIEAMSAVYPNKDPLSHKAGWDEVPGIFGKMEPFDGAIEAVKRLAEQNEVYLLSTAPWNNPSAWSDKLEWVHRHFGKTQFDAEGNVNWLFKRLILSHNKHLNKGEYLVDDRKANGAGNFKGFHIHYGPAKEEAGRPGDFKDWNSVLEFFEREGLLDRR